MTPTEAAVEMGVCTSRVNDCLRYASAKLHSPERPGAIHRAYLLKEISPPEHANDGVDLVLSTGQHKILRGLAGGQNLGWIAANRGVPVGVVRRDMRALMALADARTTVHLIRRGWELGLLVRAPYFRGSAMTAKLEDLPRVPRRKILTGKDREHFRVSVSVVYVSDSTWAFGI
ncbi:hypothetical protein [Streptomyces sp. GMR22]|uniref:hypothetical protein n=1 Tax=Streptomyces sp. GMR22 TaxID=2759524 RepID=UPI0015FBFA9A|nr:hypothetical protein [Streptomyces sp. GMR22]MBA6440661.1 hypothetical protein [Streptomyces sp. GMR22]